MKIYPIKERKREEEKENYFYLSTAKESNVTELKKNIIYFIINYNF